MRLSLLLAIAASSAIAAVFDDDEYLGFAVIQVMVEGQREPVDRYVSVIKRDREYITDACQYRQLQYQELHISSGANPTSCRHVRRRSSVASL